ncbi:MAG TPA: hypothetical protein VI318_05795 [Baekduia sp.]
METRRERERAPETRRDGADAIDEPYTDQDLVVHVAAGVHVVVLHPQLRLQRVDRSPQLV